jgi:hypothetical protein
MGIRIHKTIGYFVRKSKIKSIMVPNYMDLLNEFSSKQNANKIIEELKQLTSTFSEDDKMIYDMSLMGNLTEKDVMESISLLYNTDEFKGILFKRQNTEDRFSENIDYYSCTKKELSHCKFQQKKILSPIYPCYGYIYTGTNNEKIQDVMTKHKKNVGDVIAQLLSPLSYIVLGDVSTTLTAGENAKKLGCFAPNFEVYLYYIAKTIGLLKENISLIDFAKVIDPSVITYWS